MLELNASIFGRGVPVGFAVMGLALISWAILKGTPPLFKAGLATLNLSSVTPGAALRTIEARLTPAQL
jgi:hypothetical protein